MMISRVMIRHYVFTVCRLVLNVNLVMCWYNSVAIAVSRWYNIM